MPRFESHIHFLKLVSESTPRQRKALLKSASPAQKLALIELVHNFLKGSILVASEIKDSLSKHKHVLRVLSKKSSQKSSFFVENAVVIKTFLDHILPILS